MKKAIVIFIIIVSIALVGCSKTKSTIENEIIDNDKAVSNSEDVNNEDSTKEELGSQIEIVDSSKETLSNETDDKIEEGKVRSPFTGLYVDEESINKRPIAVMLDNYYKARPQAGLSSADIVYEILAEGNITRYLAIFNTDKPELIGPVRSARPYFISKALEYDPLYVHVGGSPQAFADIANLKMADIDALSAGKNIFWRKKHKPIPNNMYTNYDAIVKEGARRNYRDVGNYETLSFNDRDEEIVGEPLNSIKFPYSKGYISEFKYNQNTKLYDRYINNKPLKDEATNLQISAKNVIVQYAAIKVIDNKGRLEIDLVGEGKGTFITNGSKMEITWRKKDSRDLTRFYGDSGNEIKLNPGVTWYQVVPSNMKVIID